VLSYQSVSCAAALIVLLVCYWISNSSLNYTQKGDYLIRMLSLQEVLRPLGITRRYTGFEQLEQAIEIVANDQDAIGSIRKRIFYPISERYYCDWKSVERNVRTLVDRAWKVNPQYLEKLAGYPLNRKPTAIDFVDIVAQHVLYADKRNA
jgi:two-component system response regulator (stage 0 sporulation protein A)